MILPATGKAHRNGLFLCQFPPRPRDLIKYPSARRRVERPLFSSPERSSNDAALVHHQNAVAVLERVAQVVRDHDAGELFSLTITVGSCMMTSAVLGSNAAVCSSRIRKRIGVIADMMSDNACRGRRRGFPTRAFSLFSLSPARAGEQLAVSGRGAVVGAKMQVVGLTLVGRRADRFSKIRHRAAVPIAGFW